MERLILGVLYADAKVQFFTLLLLITSGLLVAMTTFSCIFFKASHTFHNVKCML